MFTYRMAKDKTRGPLGEEHVSGAKQPKAPEEF